MKRVIAGFWLVVVLVCGRHVVSADWPQFMRVPEHTGDASSETLRLPLKLGTFVRLSDAVLASPAVAAGRVFVVDQMGTAYCVDPTRNRVVWKSSPDGPRAMGGNTSSPCVAGGRVCYGTTAGKVHVLDARNGKVLKSVDVGSPVTGSLTYANESLYFQSVGAKVFRMDLAGRILWAYDHYRSYKSEDPRFRKRGNAVALGTNLPMYGGGEVAVSGKRVVVNLGWDVFCLEDTGAAARLAWCNRLPLWGCSRGSGSTWMGICAGPSINGPWVYAGYPGCELVGDVVRLRLEDGFTNPAEEPLKYVWNRGRRRQGWRQHWAVFSTVAVRDETAFAQSHHAGVVAHEFGKGTKWWGFPHPEHDAYSSSTPGIAGVTLSKDHCVFATVRGELTVVAIDSTGKWPNFKPAPFTFETPSGKCIASCPVIADGCVYFGSDDGCLYGLSPEGKLKAEPPRDEIHRRRSKLRSPTGKEYAQPGPYGTQANTNYVDDPELKVPFRLRWATRTGVMLKAPMCAGKEDIFYLGMAGTVGAVEQETGRIRWRRRLAGGRGWLESPLWDDGRLYVPRTRTFLYCLDASDGSTKWSRPIGAAASPHPVVSGGMVAYASTPAKSKIPVLRAYDAETGADRWRFEFSESLGGGVVSGCVLDGTMYFSCGGVKGPGRTIAVEPRSGKVLWQNRERHCGNRTVLAAANGRLYVTTFFGSLMCCLSARDGSLLWEKKNRSTYRAPSIAPGLLTSRSYGGGNARALDPETGEYLVRAKKPVFAGAPGHTCGPVTLTASDLSLAVTVSGLHVRDLNSGRIVWSSPGFAPRACASPVVASGRIFHHPQNGMLYCFEPVGNVRIGRPAPTGHGKD